MQNNVVITGSEERGRGKKETWKIWTGVDWKERERSFPLLSKSPEGQIFCSCKMESRGKFLNIRTGFY